MEITLKWEEIGKSNKVLKEGRWMKRQNQKLPPGRMGIFLVDGAKRVRNYLKNVYKIPDYIDQQFNK
jgi:hypothetical protein